MENVEMKIENQKIQIKNLEAKNKKLEDSKDNLMAFIKRQYEVIQSITEKHNTEIVNAQKVIDEKNKTISGLEHDVKNLKNGNELLQNNIDARDREMEKLKEQLEEKNKENDKLLCHSLNLEFAFNDAYEMYERQKNELETKDDELDYYKKRYADINALDEQVTNYKNLYLNLSENNKKLRTIVDEAEERANEYGKKYVECGKQLEAKDKDIQALMDQLDARDREIEKYKFIVIQMADDLYGKGDLDRGEEEDE